MAQVRYFTKCLFLRPKALKAAISYDKKGVVEILLKHNVAVNAVDPGDRWTVLTEAVIDHNVDMVELLLQNNVDPNGDTRSGRSALIWAVKRGSFDMGKSIF